MPIAVFSACTWGFVFLQRTWMQVCSSFVARLSCSLGDRMQRSNFQLSKNEQKSGAVPLLWEPVKWPYMAQLTVNDLNANGSIKMARLCPIYQVEAGGSHTMARDQVRSRLSDGKEVYVLFHQAGKLLILPPGLQY